jgi:erythromycin esterase-like protein
LNLLDLAKLARKNYACFEKYSDEHEYGMCAGTNLTAGCEKEAIKVLTKMLERHAQVMTEEKISNMEADESFYAMENAKIVREAEKYYRHMFEGGQITWNIRDTHMCDCLQDLLKHYGSGTKAVIWVIKSNFSFMIIIFI